MIRTVVTGSAGVTGAVVTMAEGRLKVLVFFGHSFWLAN
jgi:hypothetical protein